MTDPDDRRAVLCDWFRANGIDPDRVPLNADMTIEADDTGRRWIRCELFAADAKGERFMNAFGTDAALTRIMVPLQTEPPSWWEPHVKPTREQLLEAVGGVRQLHRPADHCGQTICAHCSSLDEQGTTDNAPVPHPCATVLALAGLPTVTLAQLVDA